MSRPSERWTDTEAAGECDENRGEFWLTNPWHAGQTPHNLSAFEPNQVFVNLGNMQFANASWLTGADSDGDGRGVLVADVNGDLQPDLVVRQTGGGPIIVYENRFPPAARLELTLRGVRSNARGIGARVEARIGERTVRKQLFPEFNFLVTQSTVLRLGLGDAKKIDELTIYWPSGEVQRFRDVSPGLHLRITEGQDTYEPLVRAGTR